MAKGVGARERGAPARAAGHAVDRHDFPSDHAPMPTRSRVLTTTPVLVVADLRRSLAFYRRLGFGEPNVHGEPPCFAMLSRDRFELMLTQADGECRVQPNGPSGTWDVYVRIDDVAAEQAALAAAGVTLAKGPSDLFYAMREIEVLDPDGHRLCFAQDIS